MSNERSDVAIRDWIRTWDDLPWAAPHVTLIYPQRRLVCRSGGLRTERIEFADAKARHPTLANGRSAWALNRCLPVTAVRQGVSWGKRRAEKAFLAEWDRRGVIGLPIRALTAAARAAPRSGGHADWSVCNWQDGSFGRSVIFIAVVVYQMALTSCGPVGTTGEPLLPVWIWPELRQAARRLSRVPLFALATVLLLAISIGGTTFVFSLIRGLLLGAVPYGNAERIVVLTPTTPRWDLVDEASGHRSLFEDVNAYTLRAVNLSGHGPAERVLAGRVTSGFFRMTGVRASAGRLLGDADFGPSRDPVVLITDALSRRRFGAPRAAVGHTLTLDGRPYTVIGVLPPTFQTVEEMQRAHDMPFDRAISVIVPLWGGVYHIDPTGTDNVFRDITLLGRLRPGVSVRQVNTELAPLLRSAERTYQAAGPFAFVPLPEHVAGELPKQLAILSLAVGILLLVGCANVANLLFARAEGHRRELAIRSAIGASRVRIMASVIAEAVLLSGGGAAIGVLGTWEAISITKVFAGGLLDVANLTLDPAVLAFAGGIAVTTALFVGLGPASRSARMEPGAVLPLSVGASRVRGGISPSSLLVTAQVGLAVLLVVVASLLARAFVRSVLVDPGFTADGVLSAETSLDRSAYFRQAGTRFFDELIGRLAAVPGVAGVAVVSTAPGGQFDAATGVNVDGRLQVVNTGVVSPQYFSVLSIPVLAGRTFTEADTGTSPYVVIVNDTFARQHWGTADHAVGQRIGMGTLATTTATGIVVRDIERTVIGVVADSRDGSAGARGGAKLYSSYKQETSTTQMTMLVKSATGDAAGLVQPLTRVVRGLDPDQPLYNVLPLSHILRSRLARQRMMAAVMNAFALFALMVAVLGVHAAMTYAGALRRHEIGVRLALGASRNAVLWSLASRGAKQVFVGLELGLLLAVTTITFLRAWLLGTEHADLSTVLAAFVLVAGISAVALLAPAWRAAAADPLETLRAE